MNPSLHWTQLVTATMAEARCDHSTAWLATARTHPDAANLFQAYGASPDKVKRFSAKFVNSVPPTEKAEARKKFRRFVNDLVERGHDYTSAFNAVARDHPDMSARANGQPSVTFANAGGTIPIFGPQMKALFRLPQSVDQETCQAAWRGNGERATPLSVGKVFDALCKLVQARTGVEYEVALQSAKGKFPQLWQAVEQLAAQAV